MPWHEGKTGVVAPDGGEETCRIYICDAEGCKNEAESDSSFCGHHTEYHESIADASVGELLNQFSANLMIAGGLRDPEPVQFESQQIELEILRRFAEEELAYESLLRACVLFQATRGKHDGDHICPQGGGPCTRCEEAYIKAETEFDEELKNHLPF